MSLGQAAHVVVGLDARGHARLAARLDHVRVERPLDEERHLAQPPGFLLEHADELLADAAALLLRVVDAFEPRQEALGRIDVHERHVEVLAEGLHHLRPLVLAQQAVVDEDARQLVADRPVDEQRGDRRVDATRQPAEHALGPDLRTDALHLLLDHRGRSPSGRRTGDAVEEVLEHRLAVRRVHDLGMELHAVQAALRGLERRHRRGGRARRHLCALGRRRHGVAMAHPAHLLLGKPREELAAVDAQRRLPELGDVRALDGAPQLLAINCAP